MLMTSIIVTNSAKFLLQGYRYLKLRKDCFPNFTNKVFLIQDSRYINLRKLLEIQTYLIFTNVLLTVQESREQGIL